MKLILWSTLSFLLIGTLAFVVACDREEEEAKEEVVLTIGTIPEFTTLDPNNLQSIESPYHKAVTDALVKLSADTLQPTPKLATDWSFSPDARSLTLTIRKGVKFHNGRELTPDDVLQNLNRILDPETGLSIHGSFGTIERGEVVGRHPRHSLQGTDTRVHEQDSLVAYHRPRVLRDREQQAYRHRPVQDRGMACRRGTGS